MSIGIVGAGALGALRKPSPRHCSKSRARLGSITENGFSANSATAANETAIGPSLSSSLKLPHQAIEITGLTFGLTFKRP
jgi:hypothetical protein